MSDESSKAWGVAIFDGQGKTMVKRKGCNFYVNGCGAVIVNEILEGGKKARMVESFAAGSWFRAYLVMESEEKEVPAP